MPTQRHAILSRHKDHDLHLSRPTNFELGAGEPYDVDAIAADPQLSLHCLDFERRRALFAETDADADLLQSPFLFVAQFRKARAMVAAPFDELRRIADAAPLDPSRLILLHSVGRCGSTLVRNVLASQPSVCCLSEPDAFTQIVDAAGAGEISAAEAQELTELCARLCAKPMRGDRDAPHRAIKFRSQCVQIAGLLARAFPEARNLYIDREPLGWLESAYRAFVDPSQAQDPAYRLRFEDVFARMMPLVRERRVEGAPMPLWKIWLLNWISNTEAILKLREQGAPFLALSFEELNRDPEAAMRRIFEYCKIEYVDWQAARRALAADSQEGSVVARDAISDAQRRLSPVDRAQAAALLEEWQRERAAR